MTTRISTQQIHTVLRELFAVAKILLLNVVSDRCELGVSVNLKTLPASSHFCVYAFAYLTGELTIVCCPVEQPHLYPYISLTSFLCSVIVATNTPLMILMQIRHMSNFVTFFKYL